MSEWILVKKFLKFKHRLSFPCGFSFNLNLRTNKYINNVSINNTTVWKCVSIEVQYLIDTLNSAPFLRKFHSLCISQNKNSSYLMYFLSASPSLPKAWAGQPLHHLLHLWTRMVSLTIHHFQLLASHNSGIKAQFKQKKNTVFPAEYF